MALQNIQDSDMTHCIQNCLTAHRACLEALHHCLSQKSTRFQGKLIQHLQLCADTCLLSAKMMIADMEMHHQSCELSFEMSRACAEERARFTEDPELMRCADACRACADSCKAMAGMTVTISANERDQRPRGTIQ